MTAIITTTTFNEIPKNLFPKKGFLQFYIVKLLEITLFSIQQWNISIKLLVYKGLWKLAASICDSRVNQF